MGQYGNSRTPRPDQPCQKCEERGHEHDYSPKRCQAHTKARQCIKNPMTGQRVCSTHGGSTSQARAKAAERIAHQVVEGEVASLIEEALGVVQGRSGIEHLTDAIEHAAAMKTAYGWLLSSLPIKSQWSYTTVESVSGSVQRLVNVEDEGMLGPDQHGVQKLHAYEEGLRYWSKLHAEITAKAMALGIEDRRQRFEMEQVQAVASAIRHLVAGLGRELDDPEVVPVVQGALAIVTGGRELAGGGP